VTPRVRLKKPTPQEKLLASRNTSLNVTNFPKPNYAVLTQSQFLYDVFEPRRNSAPF